MDGVRWDYPGRDHLPAFRAMAESGLCAGRLTPPFPSLTFSSHATLATGVEPSAHGIVANSFLDRATDRRFSDEPEASWLSAEPLWVRCERAGLKAAVRSWPCSQGSWNGVSPSYFRAYESGDHDRETIRWILDLLRRPPGERPSLIMAWVRGADGPGHAEGPDGEGVHRAMAAADGLLAELRAGLRTLAPRAPVDLLVVSDHGMAKVDRVVNPLAAIPKEGYFPFLASSGPVCNITVRNEAQRRQVAAALHRLPKDVLAMTGPEAAVRFRYEYPGRTGDFVLLCPPGATFSSFGRKRAQNFPRGMHGYDPALSEMGGIFYAEGPHFPAGKTLAKVRAVDIAPTVCACLGLSPPSRSGGRNLSNEP
jgi:alkaline phosphatase D